MKGHPAKGKGRGHQGQRGGRSVKLTSQTLDLSLKPCDLCEMPVCKYYMEMHKAQYCLKLGSKWGFGDTPGPLECPDCGEKFALKDLVKHVVDQHSVVFGRRDRASLFSNEKAKGDSNEDIVGHNIAVREGRRKMDRGLRKRKTTDLISEDAAKRVRDSKALYGGAEDTNSENAHVITKDEQGTDNIVEENDKEVLLDADENIVVEDIEVQQESDNCVGELLANKDMKCPVCDTLFRNRSAMLRHKRAVHGKQEEPLKLIYEEEAHAYHCDICYKQFSYGHSLKRHVELVHDKKPKFTCEICGESFLYSPKLTRHIAEIHEGITFISKANEVNKCKECGGKIKGSLISHMWVVHGIDNSKNRKLLQCDLCGQRVNSEINLISHKNKHTGERSFKCDVCGAAFKQPSTLRKHMKLHTGKKEFKCQYCNREFARKTYVQQHERLHTGEKPFGCHLCDKSFAQKTSLNVHLKSQHDVVQPRTVGPTKLRRVQPVEPKKPTGDRSENTQACVIVVEDHNRIMDGEDPLVKGLQHQRYFPPNFPTNKTVFTQNDAPLQSLIEGARDTGPESNIISSEKEMAAAQILCNLDPDALGVEYYQKTTKQVSSQLVDNSYGQVKELDSSFTAGKTSNQAYSYHHIVQDSQICNINISAEESNTVEVATTKTELADLSSSDVQSLAAIAYHNTPSPDPIPLSSTQPVLDVGPSMVTGSKPYQSASTANAPNVPYVKYIASTCGQMHTHPYVYPQTVSVPTTLPKVSYTIVTKASPQQTQPLPSVSSLKKVHLHPPSAMIQSSAGGKVVAKPETLLQHMVLAQPQTNPQPTSTLVAQSLLSHPKPNMAAPKQVLQQIPILAASDQILPQAQFSSILPTQQVLTIAAQDILPQQPVSHHLPSLATQPHSSATTLTLPQLVIGAGQVLPQFREVGQVMTQLVRAAPQQFVEVTVTKVEEKDHA